MREIKFRGKTKDGQWIEGVPIKNGFGKLAFICVAITDNLSCPMEKIHNFCKEVIPQTVTQYTGLKDMNGVEICEGDIVKGCFETGRFLLGSIVYEKAIAAFVISPTDVPIFKFPLPEIYYPEVIGNIYENPELMEG